MSQKIERPVLSGQRIKTRKRDEREKYDPTGFRDAVIAGLEKTEGDLEQIFKYLDIAGNKLDYRRYGEVLFDILIAGGLLVPGGSISQDGEKPRTSYCIFEANEDIETMRNHEQVFVKLMRRYRFLEKMFEEEMKKVLVFIKGFTPSERTKLARMTALWLVNGSVPPTVLLVLNNEHLIKDGIALDFLIEVFVAFKQEKGIAHLVQALKKGGLESKLMDFFPPNKRTEEYLKQVFLEKELTEIIKLHKAQASQEAKRELQQTLIDDIHDEKAHSEITADIKEFALRNNIPDHEIIIIIWSTIMSLGEWNKKEELVTDQAVRHLKAYCPLLQAFASTDRSELALILKVQEFCYENMNFMKAFQKIILLFYKTEVLSEESILRWYKDAHSSKGKMHFLEQMRKFVEWLQSAEEESESEDEQKAQSNGE
ncbi:protein krasavietz [Bactrocera oleae]|uniref:protein krasavietz n=1 Tax=Bactrocera oleae TaxID=104688 RepID=UPI0006B71908|nr:protein krasavietz isoform X1 [Bactrocera oleae]XP_014093784.1 protein krasavietz isoform X1 [Bactrocera oleae]XP_014093785.1 protein krasavietz isoform X1 [Bactrocera oleae]XP_036228905.1 protein krasavietz isoform X1 [Bactrocera oleae]XP_036228907.1 protein krasavietz isoform X1 [Bactrocera oleae]XP_036228908.1 protein krasavietz isoform X1 [Bactrocera oleae]XP_036228909.1 protein krasavietz isoform X1 [Bactrocera oleae]XP_036228910.1 protein krasavietz isoform X1 [Bactrocera oleae]XP_